MSESQLRAHYARTAPIKDLEFFLSFTLTDDLRARAVRLYGDIIRNGKATAASKAGYRALQAEWRSYQLLRERQLAAWAGLAPLREGLPVFYRDGSTFYQLTARPDVFVQVCPPQGSCVIRVFPSDRPVTVAA